MWISKNRFLRIEKMVDNHERDLKEQLEVNRRMKRDISKNKSFLQQIKKVLGI